MYNPSLAELEFRSALHSAMDGNLRQSKRRELLDGYRTEILKGTVPIALDVKVHPVPPTDSAEILLYSYLDTVHNLLREAAVRSVIQELREAAAETGLPFAETDEELFAEMATEVGDSSPKEFIDLAPILPEVASIIAVAYQALYRAVHRDAVEAAEHLQREAGE